MNLTEHLSATGVKLGLEVGVIVEEIDDNKETKVTTARIARICVDLPEFVRNHPDVKDFDPEYDIAVVWGVTEKQICVLRMTDDAVLYGLDIGGIIIDSPKARIMIGQSETFMGSVCDLMCALAAPK